MAEKLDIDSFIAQLETIDYSSLTQEELVDHRDELLSLVRTTKIKPTDSKMEILVKEDINEINKYIK